MRLALRAFTALLLLIAAAACDPKPRPQPQPTPQPDTSPDLDPRGHLFAPGALSDPSMSPIGGGEGYGDWVEPQAEPVGDLAGLIEALGTAESGDVVYVADDARIDASGHLGIVVPEGVTLAGGRGRDGALGGLVFNGDRTTTSKVPVFYLSPESRITGLRLQGPSIAADWAGCAGETARAIGVVGENDGADLDIRVDNNELYGWSVGVAVTYASGVTVDHNHIHHNQRRERDPAEDCRHWSLGYGVSLGTGHERADGGPQAAHVLVEANLFHHNRHDIASDGGRGTSYSARYNIVHDARISHTFDVHEGKRIETWTEEEWYLANPDPCEAFEVVHGDCPPPRWDRSEYQVTGSVGTGVAGAWVEIHHNTFLQQDFHAVKIRAVPEYGAWVHHNQFLHPDSASAVRQQIDSELIPGTDNYGLPVDEKLEVYANESGVGPVRAWFAAPGGASAPLNVGDEVEGVGLGGEGAPDDREPGFWTLRRFDATPMLEVAFGDFDCDGRADAFRTTGSTWEYSPDARGDWVKLNASGIQLHNLRLGDFDGDGCTDVFRAKPSANRWYVSWGGRSGWAELNASGVGLEHLAFGDFDGDGATDVFKANGSSWRVSWGGQTGWTYMGASGLRVEDLVFGDFDGDRRTDVLRADGGDWWVSHGGNSAWIHLNVSGEMKPDLGFGDFDGDGTTDVLRRGPSSGKWEISWSGRSNWEKTRTSSLTPDLLGFADVNGDGATDILSMQEVD